MNAWKDAESFSRKLISKGYVGRRRGAEEPQKMSLRLSLDSLEPASPFLHTDEARASLKDHGVLLVGLGLRRLLLYLLDGLLLELMPVLLGRTGEGPHLNH